MARAHLLDITRLASRLGRGPLTGIDRVEFAYLTHLLGQTAPLFGLVRTRFGYLLMARDGCQKLVDLVTGLAPLPRPNWARQIWGITRLGPSVLRPFCAARQPRFRLGALLRAVPSGALYLNVGHSNLTAEVLAAIGRAGLTRLVLIHDTIPLDHPEFARDGTVAPFAKKIAAVAQYADTVIHISQDARAKTERHFAAHGRVPQGVTAPLGLVMAAPATPPFMPKRPYFVALGTIEPRKNLKLLFDIWQDMGAPEDAPQLVVIGAKGWADAALFAQMTRLMQAGLVIHGENLSDGAVVTLLQGAAALLFPSLAEGFGLPPVEAAALGVPVVASDLPVLRETCGNFAVYLDPRDSYSWIETIQILARARPENKTLNAVRPLLGWDDHFKSVLT